MITLFILDPTLILAHTTPSFLLLIVFVLHPCCSSSIVGAISLPFLFLPHYSSSIWQAIITCAYPAIPFLCMCSSIVTSLFSRHDGEVQLPLTPLYSASSSSISPSSSYPSSTSTCHLDPFICLVLPTLYTWHHHLVLLHACSTLHFLQALDDCLHHNQQLHPYLMHHHLHLLITPVCQIVLCLSSLCLTHHCEDFSLLHSSVALY